MKLHNLHENGIRDLPDKDRFGDATIVSLFDGPHTGYLGADDLGIFHLVICEKCGIETYYVADPNQSVYFDRDETLEPLCFKIDYLGENTGPDKTNYKITIIADDGFGHSRYRYDGDRYGGDRYGNSPHKLGIDMYSEKLTGHYMRGGVPTIMTSEIRKSKFLPVGAVIYSHYLLNYRHNNGGFTHALELYKTHRKCMDEEERMSHFTPENEQDIDDDYYIT